MIAAARDAGKLLTVGHIERFNPAVRELRRRLAAGELGRVRLPGGRHPRLADVQRYVMEVLDWVGVEAIEAEELSVIPGLDEVFSLADIKTFTALGHIAV